MTAAPDERGGSGRRTLGARQLEFLALGTAIGSGLFVGSAQALRSAGASLLLIYAGCAVAVYAVARCMGEMALAFPDEPSFVHHVRRQLGRAAGRLCGWGYWSTLVLIGMAELTAVGLLGRAVLPEAPPWTFVGGAVVVLTAVNLRPAGVLGAVEIWMSSLKIGVTLLFIGLGLAALGAPARLGLSSHRLADVWSPEGMLPSGWRGLLQALPQALFAFGGFELVGLAARETKSPERAIPRAVNGLLARFAIFYLGVTLALLILLPLDAVRPGTSPFLTVLERWRVPGATNAVAWVLISCILSSCNALIFGAARTLESLAIDHDAPARLGRLSRAGVPWLGVLLTSGAIAMAVLIVAVAPEAAFGLLMKLVGLFTLLNWGLIVLSELNINRRRGATPMRQPFRLPGAPYTSFVALVFIASVFILNLFALS